MSAQTITSPPKKCTKGSISWWIVLIPDFCRLFLVCFHYTNNLLNITLECALLGPRCTKLFPPFALCAAIHNLVSLLLELPVSRYPVKARETLWETPTACMTSTCVQWLWILIIILILQIFWSRWYLSINIKLD